MSKKKPIILIAAIILAVATAVSASTFAWFTAHDEVVNKIETAKLTDGDVSILETFDPDDRLMPGVDINKDVGAINTGDAPALVRISFQELLQKLEKKDRGDYQVRNATKGAGAGYIAELANVSKFAATGSQWTKLTVNATTLSAITTNFPYNLFGGMDATVAGSSAANLVDLVVTQGIEFWFYETVINANVKKYTWSAYVELGTTPKTYQRVELRPELFNMIRVGANTGNPADDSFFLKVVKEDPAKGKGKASGEIEQYMNPANGDGRFYSYITLQLENGGTPYEAQWFVQKGASAPIDATFRPANRWMLPAAGKTDLRMSAVTDFGTTPPTTGSIANLQLVFFGDNVFLGTAAQLKADFDSATPTCINKWWYNPADGFFYYIGVVEPGQATELLLDAISLSGAAESDYSHVNFDLTVVMDAIQATAEAVTSTVGGGWGANYYNTPATVGAITAGSDLAYVLEKLCPVLD